MAKMTNARATAMQQEAENFDRAAREAEAAGNATHATAMRRLARIHWQLILRDGRADQTIVALAALTN